MRIAITGGTGFVGGTVADVLMKDGHDVVLMDKQKPKWHPTAMYQELDVTDRLQCMQAFQGFQVVMHLAAMSNTQMAVNNPWLCTEINCLGTVNVLDGCRDAAVERVVVAGSSLVSTYQVDVGQLTVRFGVVAEDRSKLTEHDPFSVTSSYHPYVTTKLFEEMLARDYREQYGLPITVLRYGIQYGPRMTPGVVVHSFIERALRGWPLTIHGDGKQWRQYLHVEDVARAHKLVIDKWDMSDGETFNVVSDEKVTILDLARAVQAEIPVGIEHVEERGTDIWVKMVSNEAAKRDLDWRPEIDLQTGIAQTINWYKKHLASGMKRR